MSYIDGLPTAPSVNDDDLLVIDQGGSGVPGSGTTYKTPVLSVRGTGGLVPITARSLLANSTGGNALPTATTLGTGLSFTGTSLGLNGALPASTAITQNGSIILNSYGAGLGDGTLMLIGKGAGASLPAGAVNMVAIGTNALGSDIGTNSENVAVGWGALRNLTTGQFSTAIGLNAGGLIVTDTANTLVGCDAMRNGIGSFNAVVGDGNLRDGEHDKTVAIGHAAMSAFGATTAVTTDNVVVGYSAMSSAAITTASSNVVVGSQAGFSLVSGNSNCFIGFQAGKAATLGGSNCCIGANSGLLVTTGSSNVFIGLSAGSAATTTSGAVGIGLNALLACTIGGAVAVGNQAGKSLTSGISTLLGNVAGFNLTTGSNVAVGNAALQGAAAATASLNTAVGDGALSSVSSAPQNCAYGRNAGNKISTGGQNVIIGSSVASTTLATGNTNIIIGVDSSADTVAAGTSDTLLIKGKTGGAAWLSGTGGATATPTLSTGGLFGLAAFTVATLPAAAAANTGCIAYVTDATAPTYRGALVGGGAVKTLVFSDGTAWTSH